MSNLFLSALGTTVGMGGPLEDALNIFTIKETGGLGNITQGLTRGQETTKIGAAAECLVDLGINALPFHLKLPVVGVRSLIEFCRGDMGDALSSLLMVAPYLSKVKPEKLSAVLKAYDTKVASLVKTATDQGGKAAVQAFSKEAGAAARVLKNNLWDQFKSGYELTPVCAA